MKSVEELAAEYNDSIIGPPWQEIDDTRPPKAGVTDIDKHFIAGYAAAMRSEVVKGLVEALMDHAHGALDNFECKHGFSLDKCPPENECVDRRAHEALAAFDAQVKGGVGEA
jgi:hypothetical protein